MDQTEKDSKQYRKAKTWGHRRRHLAIIGHDKMRVKKRLEELDKDARFKPKRPIIDTSLPSDEAIPSRSRVEVPF